MPIWLLCENTRALILFSYYEENNKDTVQQLLFLYRNQRSIKSYYVIRIEDLVSSPEKQIRIMCDFLDISFEPILMTPTYHGKFWGGNSITGQVFKGIDSSNLNKWKTEIYPMEVQYINKLFPFVLRYFSYEMIYDKGLFWKPAKGENLKRYFANRFYKFFLTRMEIIETNDFST